MTYWNNGRNVCLHFARRGRPSLSGVGPAAERDKCSTGKSLLLNVLEDPPSRLHRKVRPRLGTQAPKLFCAFPARAASSNTDMLGVESHYGINPAQKLRICRELIIRGLDTLRRSMRHTYLT